MSHPASEARWRVCLCGVLSVLWTSAMAASPEASESPRWWQRFDQAAHQAYQQGDYARAEALATDPEAKAMAQYRQGRVDEAISQLRDLGSARSLYNAGTMAAEQARYQEAADLLEKSLQKNAADPQTQANLEAVKQALEAQQQNQPSDGGGEPEQGEQGDQGAKQSGDQGEQGGGDSGGDQGDSQDDQNDQSDQDESQNGDQPEPSTQAASSASAAEADELAKQREQLERQQAQQRAEQQAAQSANETGSQTESSGSSEPVASRNAPTSALDAERRQRIEQQLKRVPDDPAALLRNKIQLQHQRRYGDRIDEEQAW